MVEIEGRQVEALFSLVVVGVTFFSTTGKESSFVITAHDWTNRSK